MVKRVSLFIFIFLFSLVSCEKQKVDLNTIINENKIIFIGENHSIVNPRLYLIENLETLYNCGVRHICMEGFSLRNPKDGNYNFYCFFPWSVAGSKYEDVFLSQKIEEINAGVSESEKLKIYNPEEFLLEKDIENYEYYEKLNLRDTASYNFIEDLYHTIPKEEKILIFYGYNHGSKKNINRKWETLGQRLNKNYEDFVSINFDYSLGDNEFSYIEKQNSFTKYDYLIKQQKNPSYGICYQFIDSKENTQVLINHLLEYAKSDNLFSTDFCDSLSDEREFLNCIYYLKMMYKDNFSYDFWAQKDDLEIALEKLQNYVSQQEIQFSNDINRLRNYHKFMVDSGIEDYIYGYEKLDLEYTKNMLEKAFSYYQEDVWCLYWLALVEFDLKEYNQAFIDFEKCLEYETINNIEVLPKIYEKLISISDKIDEPQKKTFYEEKLKNLSEIKIINVNKMTDIR